VEQLCQLLVITGQKPCIGFSVERPHVLLVSATTTLKVVQGDHFIGLTESYPQDKTSFCLPWFRQFMSIENDKRHKLV
jgi:hypothetical protein